MAKVRVHVRMILGSLHNGIIGEGEGTGINIAYWLPPQFNTQKCSHNYHQQKDCTGQQQSLNFLFFIYYLLLRQNVTEIDTRSTWRVE